MALIIAIKAWYKSYKIPKACVFNDITGKPHVSPYDSQRLEPFMSLGVKLDL